MRIAEIVSKFRPSRAQSASVPKSALGALREIVGPMMFRELTLQSPDRREIFALAAEQLRIDELSLLESIAQRLSLPLAKCIGESQALPAGLSIAELLAASCIPCMENGMPVSLVCADPAFVSHVISILGVLPLRIGSWAEIRGAIDTLKRRVERDAADTEIAKQERHRKLAKTALDSLLNQASVQMQSMIRIFDAGHELTYEFDTLSDRCARGAVRGAAREALLLYLREMSLSTQPSTLRRNGEALELKVECVNPVRYLVSWKGAEGAKKEEGKNIIQFPQPQSPQNEEVLSDNADPLATSEPMRSRVLVIDDNATFVRVLERFLGRHDFDVTHVSDGEGALSLLRQDKSLPHIVICDVHMPGVDGHEFLRRLRGQTSFQLLPVVALTSDGDVETKLKLLGEGADAVITKNEDPRVLCIQVKRLVTKHRVLEAA